MDPSMDFDRENIQPAPSPSRTYSHPFAFEEIEGDELSSSPPAPAPAQPLRPTQATLALVEPRTPRKAKTPRKTKTKARAKRSEEELTTTPGAPYPYPYPSTTPLLPPPVRADNPPSSSPWQDPEPEPERRIDFAQLLAARTPRRKSTRRPTAVHQSASASSPPHPTRETQSQDDDDMHLLDMTRLSLLDAQTPRPAAAAEVESQRLQLISPPPEETLSAQRHSRLTNTPLARKHSATYTPALPAPTPASVSYTLASTSYTPASTTYTPASTSYTPASVSHTPASTSYTPASTTYTPASASTSYTPPSASSAPDPTPRPNTRTQPQSTTETQTQIRAKRKRIHPPSLPPLPPPVLTPALPPPVLAPSPPAPIIPAPAPLRPASLTTQSEDAAPAASPMQFDSDSSMQVDSPFSVRASSSGRSTLDAAGRNSVYGGTNVGASAEVGVNADTQRIGVKAQVEVGKGGGEVVGVGVGVEAEAAAEPTVDIEATPNPKPRKLARRTGGPLPTPIFGSTHRAHGTHKSHSKPHSEPHQKSLSEVEQFEFEEDDTDIHMGSPTKPRPSPSYILHMHKPAAPTPARPSALHTHRHSGASPRKSVTFALPSSPTTTSSPTQLGSILSPSSPHAHSGGGLSSPLDDAHSYDQAPDARAHAHAHAHANEGPSTPTRSRTHTDSQTSTRKRSHSRTPTSHTRTRNKTPRRANPDADYLPPLSALRLSGSTPAHSTSHDSGHSLSPPDITAAPSTFPTTHASTDALTTSTDAHTTTTDAPTTTLQPTSALPLTTLPPTPLPAHLHLLRRRSRSATPIPAYTPPVDVFASPREVYLAPRPVEGDARRARARERELERQRERAGARAGTPRAGTPRTKNPRASSSSALRIDTTPPKTKTPLKVTIKQELPSDIDLHAPMPPPSPGDDPLLLRGGDDEEGGDGVVEFARGAGGVYIQVEYVDDDRDDYGMQGMRGGGEAGDVGTKVEGWKAETRGGAEKQLKPKEEEQDQDQEEEERRAMVSVGVETSPMRASGWGVGGEAGGEEGAMVVGEEDAVVVGDEDALKAGGEEAVHAEEEDAVVGTIPIPIPIPGESATQSVAMMDAVEVAGMQDSEIASMEAGEIVGMEDDEMGGMASDDDSDDMGGGEVEAEAEVHPERTSSSYADRTERTSYTDRTEHTPPAYHPSSAPHPAHTASKHVHVESTPSRGEPEWEWAASSPMRGAAQRRAERLSVRAQARPGVVDRVEEVDESEGEIEVHEEEAHEEEMEHETEVHKKEVDQREEVQVDEQKGMQMQEEMADEEEVQAVAIAVDTDIDEDEDSLMHIAASDALVPPVQIFGPAGDGEDGWSSSDSELNACVEGEGEGEYTGRFLTLRVRTKADPPSSATRARMERWGRPISPFPPELVERRRSREAQSDPAPFDFTALPADDDGAPAGEELDPEFVKITSADPLAAARAAAILKQHDYECFTKPSPDFARSLRRRDLASASIQKSAKRASAAFTFIPGSPVHPITLPALLHAAETSLSLPPVTPAPGPRASLLRTYDTPLPLPVPVFTASGARVWTKAEWRVLDACFTDERLDLGESAPGAPPGTLAPVESLSMARVVDRFVALLGGAQALSAWGEDWTRDDLLARACALQHKQRSGRVARPSTPRSVSTPRASLALTDSYAHAPHSGIHADADADTTADTSIEVPDFTPLLNRRGAAHPRKSLLRSSVSAPAPAPVPVPAVLHVPSPSTHIAPLSTVEASTVPPHHAPPAPRSPPSTLIHRTPSAAPRRPLFPAPITQGAPFSALALAGEGEDEGGGEDDDDDGTKLAHKTPSGTKSISKSKLISSTGGISKASIRTRAQAKSKSKALMAPRYAHLLAEAVRVSRDGAFGFDVELEGDEGLEEELEQEQEEEEEGGQLEEEDVEEDVEEDGMQEEGQIGDDEEEAGLELGLEGEGMQYSEDDDGYPEQHEHEHQLEEHDGQEHDDEGLDVDVEDEDEDEDEDIAMSSAPALTHAAPRTPGPAAAQIHATPAPLPAQTPASLSKRMASLFFSYLPAALSPAPAAAPAAAQAHNQDTQSPSKPTQSKLRSKGAAMTTKRGTASKSFARPTAAAAARRAPIARSTTTSRPLNTTTRPAITRPTLSRPALTRTVPTLPTRPIHAGRVPAPLPPRSALPLPPPRPRPRLAASSSSSRPAASLSRPTYGKGLAPTPTRARTKPTTKGPVPRDLVALKPTRADTDTFKGKATARNAPKRLVQLTHVPPPVEAPLVRPVSRTAVILPFAHVHAHDNDNDNDAEADANVSHDAARAPEEVHSGKRARRDSIASTASVRSLVAGFEALERCAGKTGGARSAVGDVGGGSSRPGSRVGGDSTTNELKKQWRAGQPDGRPRWRL